MAENDGLLELAQAAKRAGAEGLYRAYSGRIFSFVLRMLNDAHAAQDVTVEAFKVAFREVVTFTSAAGFLLKLYERAYQESFRRALAVVPEDPGWREVDPEAALVDEEKLQDGLRGVPPRERGLWLLRLEGLTDVEVAFAAGYDVKAPDVGARVKDGVALAKRHFLAALSTEPAKDEAKAAEVADQLGLMFTRKPAPPQTWATIDRTLRAERIVADEVGSETSRQGREKGGVPWVVIGVVVALVALIGLGIGLRSCGGGAGRERAERQVIVGVHEGRAGVWWVVEGERIQMPAQNLRSEEDRILDWMEMWRKRKETPGFDLAKFNREGRALAALLRVRLGSHAEVEYEEAK